MTDDERARAVERVVIGLYVRERIRVWKRALGVTALIVVGLVIVLFWE